MKAQWTTADFDSLSWHDCHFYGFKLHEGAHGTAELEFDLDFIVEWLCHTDREWEFRIAPATLTFHKVFNLRFALDYVTPTAGMTPFILLALERDRIEYPTDYVSFQWRLPVSWPDGMISFEAPGFTQILRRPPILVDRQKLLPAERD